MAVGQVSFHNDKIVKRGGCDKRCGYVHSCSRDYQGPRGAREQYSPKSPLPECLTYTSTVKINTRDNAIVNRLNKTKAEREVDHEAERQERLRQEGRKKKADAVERVGALSQRVASRTLRCSSPVAFLTWAKPTDGCAFILLTPNALSRPNPPGRACLRALSSPVAPARGALVDAGFGTATILPPHWSRWPFLPRCPILSLLPCAPMP